MPGGKSETLQGTLDLTVLKTLGGMGPFDGCGIARRMEQISEEVLLVNQGTIYASLVPLIERGWISGVWARQTTTEKRNFIPSRKPDVSSSLPKR
jgi:PadR family transcriptional regulator PadR